MDECVEKHSHGNLARAIDVKEINPKKKIKKDRKNKEWVGSSVITSQYGNYKLVYIKYQCQTLTLACILSFLLFHSVHRQLPNDLSLKTQDDASALINLPSASQNRPTTTSFHTLKPITRVLVHLLNINAGDY